MVDARAPLSLHRLVADANSTYRSSRVAMNELHKLGHPPALSISPVPDTGVVTAIRVIAALQSAYSASSSEAASTIKCVRLQWRSLSRWIKLLLKDLVLSEDMISSPESVEALDHVLILLPSLLDFSSVEGTVTDLAFLHRLSPFLPQLIVRVWFKTLENHHWTYGLWSLLLIKLAASAPSTSWYTPSLEPTQGFSQITSPDGLAFAYHLYHQLKHIPTMTLQDIREFLAFMCCPALEGSRPLCSYVPGQTLPALVSLLSVVTRKRKPVQTAEVESDEYAITNGITFQILSYISSFIREPYFAAEALDSGLIRVLFRAHPCFMRADDQRTPLVRRFHYLASEIIDRIATLLVFPAILHRFWKARSAVTQYLESGIAFPLLRESWDQALEKASAIHVFRQVLKDQVSPLCDYNQCPGNATRKGLIRPRESRPSMTHQESDFFLKWLHHHISSHLTTVTDNLNRHIFALRQSSERSGCTTAARLILNGEKNPVLLVHLHKSSSPTADDIHILTFDDSDPRTDDSTDPKWKSTLLEYWRNNSSVTKSKILVAALFPNHFGYRKTDVWIFMILLELPMVEPLQYSIPNESFSCNHG
ncbi:hypothetical protein AAF712_014659 [Marasmius tenuissimus]|uniref:Uncharacterized protein n=1 Tax=Marasmius tenuissimus TaxID=585030 RepID=A0ABR2ZBK2_9AGAR